MSHFEAVINLMGTQMVAKFDNMKILQVSLTLHEP